MKNAGYQPVPSYNPCWDENGLTFADPDGYRVVIQNETWNLRAIANFSRKNCLSS